MPKEMYKGIDDKLGGNVHSVELNERGSAEQPSNQSSRGIRRRGLLKGLIGGTIAGLVASTNIACLYDRPYCDPIINFGGETLVAGGWTLVEVTEEHYKFRWDGRHKAPPGTSEESRKVFELSGAKPGDKSIETVTREYLKERYGTGDITEFKGGKRSYNRYLREKEQKQKKK